MSIRLEHVSYAYEDNSSKKNYALKDINLEIKKEEFIAVIGHTGSGKSTLIQHLNGLIKPTSGTIYFDDEDIYSEGYPLRELRGKVGICFQYPEHQLFETTILDDVCFGPMNFGKTKEEATEIAVKCLKDVGLPEKLYQKSPFELSGGQKRRVAIAGSRYGSVRVAKNRFQSEDFEKQLLYVEGGKQVSDIGIVIRVENFDELQLLESIEIIWDYDMATTTLLYVPTFMPPKRKSNCYLLKAEIRDELEESRLEIGKTRIIRNNGNTQISLRERQTNGKDHFIHYITTELSASPLGENIRIAGASKKYMKWQKRRLKEE